MRKFIFPLICLMMCCFLAGALSGALEGRHYELSWQPLIPPEQYNTNAAYATYFIDNQQQSNPDTPWWEDLPGSLPRITV
jgi:hypothetical protein